MRWSVVFLISLAICQAWCEAVNGTMRDCTLEGGYSSEVIKTMQHRWKRVRPNGFSMYLLGLGEDGYREAEHIVDEFSATIEACLPSSLYSRVLTLDMSENKYNGDKCQSLVNALETHASMLRETEGVFVVKNIHQWEDKHCLFYFMDPMGRSDWSQEPMESNPLFLKKAFVFLSAVEKDKGDVLDGRGLKIEDAHLRAIATPNTGFSPSAFINRIKLKAVVPDRLTWDSTNCRTLPVCGGTDARTSAPTSDLWDTKHKIVLVGLLGVVLLITAWRRIKSLGNAGGAAKEGTGKPDKTTSTESSSEKIVSPSNQSPHSTPRHRTNEKKENPNSDSARQYKEEMFMRLEGALRDDGAATPLKPANRIQSVKSIMKSSKIFGISPRAERPNMPSGFGDFDDCGPGGQASDIQVDETVAYSFTKTNSTRYRSRTHSDLKDK